MSQIYEKKFWGGANFDFYSGIGSHDPQITEPYIDALKKILQSFPQKLSVCDLGCGDFNVGRALVPYAATYIGIDIVPDLIDRNRALFQKPNLEFHCLDIVKDEWPKTDLVMIRQVMQHLSNVEILALVGKLKHIPFIVVTEHLPIGSFVPNKDLITGQGIRLKKKSGVDLMQAPFHLGAKNTQKILTVPYLKNQGEIVTTLYQNF